MSDYYEIDFLAVGNASKSGDAIPLRYKLGETTRIHVVDGGFVEKGPEVVSFIKKRYDDPETIDAVIATHPDGDHAGGLREVLEDFDVKALYMHRPWLYTSELIDRFKQFSNEDNLAARLKKIYPHIAKLEEIADRKGIPIHEAFQGEIIGEFTVMAPTRSRYLDLVVSSEKTPAESNKDVGSVFETAKSFTSMLMTMVKAAWGSENFSSQETAAENEMSIVQFAEVCGDKILLTGDTGRSGLTEGADYAPSIGLTLPGIKNFQVPHHGSRRNVSTETLDRWLGEKLDSQPDDSESKFNAIISAAKDDKDHPRKAVVRAMIHRGGKVVSTEGYNVRTSGGKTSERSDYSPCTPLSYPDEEEEA